MILKCRFGYLKKLIDPLIKNLIVSEIEQTYSGK